MMIVSPPDGAHLQRSNAVSKKVGGTRNVWYRGRRVDSRIAVNGSDVALPNAG
ncbi:MAG: hypothetical protein AAFV26_08610 [Pseudomonadota bacterium]